MSGAPEPILRVVAPLVNTNEPEAQVIELPAEPFTAVTEGDLLCVLETSKSAMDVTAQAGGFLGPVHVTLDQRVTAGDPICEIYAEMPDRAAVEAPAPDGDARLTRKAAALAAELGVDLSGLPGDRIITEKDIRRLADRRRPAIVPDELVAAVGERSAVVFGGGGHARSLIDVMRNAGRLEPLCVVDDAADPGESVLGVPIVGDRRFLSALAAAGVRHGVNAVGALGRTGVRVEIDRALREAGLALPALIDPSAAVAASAAIEDGAQVFAGAAVWSAARVGPGAIVNTGAIVSHDCVIGAHAHIAPGAILAGHVEVGEAALVGMGVTTRPGLRIGARAIVGNGAVLTEDVRDDAIVPAGTVWPR